LIYSLCWDTWPYYGVSDRHGSVFVLAGSLVLFYLAWLYPHGLGLLFLLLLDLFVFGIDLDFICS